MESLVNKLPEDATKEILVRLSVKLLLRFRCVCQAWCNLITSPDFIDKHFNHPTRVNDHHALIKRCLQDRATNVLSIHSNKQSLDIISPDLQIPHFDHQTVQLLGPCNGIVCFTDYEIIVLCNPATREFTLLPERPFGCPQDMHCGWEGVGFGFDTKNNDYKVIRIVDLVDREEYTFHVLKAEIYQHSTNSWREIDYDIPRVWYATCFEIFFNGCTHWSAQRDDGEKVLSFNINTEVFQEFDFPDGCPFGDEKRKSLAVLNEFLTMLAYTDPWTRTDEQYIYFWVMREYGIPKSWTKQLTVGPLSEIMQPITSQVNTALLIEKTNGQLISCAIETQEVKEFDIFAYDSTLRSLIYKETLVSMTKGSWNRIQGE